MYTFTISLTFHAVQRFLKTEAKDFFKAGMVKSGMQDHLYGHRDVMIAGMQHGTQVHYYLHAGK